MAYYGTVDEADDYFEERLNSTAWHNSSQKEIALKQSTRLIDRLNFVGCKASDTQELQFPRGIDTEVPLDVKYACYEVAITILSEDYDFDAMLNDARVVKRRFDVVETEYDRKSSVPDHLLVGIPSALAWSYLLPYLRDPRTINLSRVS